MYDVIGNPGQANYSAGNTSTMVFQITDVKTDWTQSLSTLVLAENPGKYRNHKNMMKIQIWEEELHHIFLAETAGSIQMVTQCKQSRPRVLSVAKFSGPSCPSCHWANDCKCILLRTADGRSDISFGDSDPTRDAFTAAKSLAEAGGVVEEVPV
jgi:hypothetical protein